MTDSLSLFFISMHNDTNCSALMNFFVQIFVITGLNICLLLISIAVGGHVTVEISLNCSIAHTTLVVPFMLEYDTKYLTFPDDRHPLQSSWNIIVWLFCFVTLPYEVE